MMSKFVKRVIPFESCDIPAIQSWLEDMAEKGLFFKECGVFFAKFEKGEPKKMRYRLDFCDVVACDIPDEKKELYEQSGWQVVGEFKSDFVVVCTDDPDAPEIYTEPELLVKPLKNISGRQLAAWIVFWLMYVNINYGNLDAYIEVSFSSIVRYLLDFGTWYYIALRLLQLVLLFEAIFHFVSWLRLRKLIKKLKNGWELPQGEHRRFRAAAGKLLRPLAIPAVVLFGLHLLASGYQVSLNNNEPVYDLSLTPIPTLEDLGVESGDYYTYSVAGVGHDLLADVIYGYSCDRYMPGEPMFDYRVMYYDMRSERLAELLADSYIKDELKTAHDKEVTEYIDEDNNITAYVRNDNLSIKDENLELDGAQVRSICVKYGEFDNDVYQTLCILCGDRVMYIYYKGSANIEDFAQDFVDCLK